MTTDSAHRSVRLERIENSRYVVTNDRGGQIRIGKGEGTDFTPVDLLLAGIGGCTAIDVDILTSRRAEPEKFEILVDAEKVHDNAGNHLTDIVVTFRIRFPDGRMAIRPERCCQTPCESHMTGCAQCRGPWSSARP